MSAIGATASEARFIRETGRAADVASLVEPVIESLGFRLVRVTVSMHGEAIVQIMAERADGTITVEECAIISRHVSAVLDVHDPMPAGYALEVSSPGIDRPLVRATDFETWAGYEAKVELKELVSGRKRFRGRLEGFAEGELRIEVELTAADGVAAGPQVIGLPLRLVAEARLVLTNDLIREALRRAKQARKGREGAGGTDVLDGDEAPELEIEPGSARRVN